MFRGVTWYGPVRVPRAVPAAGARLAGGLSDRGPGASDRMPGARACPGRQRAGPLSQAGGDSLAKGGGVCYLTGPEPLHWTQLLTKFNLWMSTAERCFRRSARAGQDL